MSVLKRHQCSRICLQVNSKKHVIFGRSNVKKLNLMDEKVDFRKAGGQIYFDSTVA